MPRKQPPKQVPEQAPDTPLSYTLREAAELTGVSRGTVRRYLDDGGRPGRFPNAFQDAEGVWRIPIPDLIAAGLSLKGRYTGADEKPREKADDEAVRLRAEVGELRVRLAVAEDRAAYLGAEVERLWGLVGTLTQAALPARASGLRGLFRRRGAES